MLYTYSQLIGNRLENCRQLQLNILGVRYLAGVQIRCWMLSIGSEAQMLLVDHGIEQLFEHLSDIELQHVTADVLNNFRGLSLIILYIFWSLES